MHTRYKTAKLLVCAALLLGTGCDNEGDSPKARSGENENGDDEMAAIGGGFEPSPDCDYSCFEVNAGESICTQTCPDGCLTLQLSAESVNGTSVSGVNTIAEYCPHDLPAPELGELTCRIMYIDTPGGPGDCDTEFSEQLCQLAYDICADAL